MPRVAAGVALVFALEGCTADVVPSPVTAAARDSVLAPGVAPAVIVDTLARGLVVPWGVAVLPDGRILVTEREGRIRVIAPDGRLAPEPWATLDVHAHYENWGPESGLLGIAVAPDYATTRHVFVFATVWRSEGDRRGGRVTRLWRRAAGRVLPAAGFALQSRVLRFTDGGARGTDPRVVVDGLPADHYHAGGGLAFGPDGLLYVSVGDATRPALAADRDVLTGKILRYRADGSVPADNPTPRSPVWARGLRNAQAFTWLADGTMLTVEHGPTGMPQEGGRAGDDELDVIRPGGDHGWPNWTGWDAPAQGDAPVWVWRTAIAPAGVAVAPPGLAAQGDTVTVLVAALRRRLERLTLVRDSSRWRAVTATAMLDGRWGRLRTVVAVPDGSVLVTTSNRDARGQPGADDDLLLRLRPASPR